MTKPISKTLALLCLMAAAAMVQQSHAQGAREQNDQRDVKRQQFLMRLPLMSECRAEVAGGVTLPEGESAWKSGPFEVEPLDDFRIMVYKIEQLVDEEQETCRAQAQSLEAGEYQREGALQDGNIVCMKRIWNDPARLPQLTACELRTLLTQPTHLRCKNLDPILDPDGIYVSPNMAAVITLPQAVMTKGICRSIDQSAAR